MKRPEAMIAKLASLLALAACALPASAQTAASSGKAKDVYMAAGCFQCHGTAAQGARGPTLAAVKYPYEAFRLFVRRPVGGGMPAFSQSVLPEAELREIFAYVAKLPETPSKLPALLE